MSLRDRVKNILMQPRREWRVIAREPSSVAELYLSYVAPLAAIGPPASIVGLSVVGYGHPAKGPTRVAFGTAIGHPVVAYGGCLTRAYRLAHLRQPPSTT